jgi:hypothetical protein
MYRHNRRIKKAIYIQAIFGALIFGISVPGKHCLKQYIYKQFLEH